MYRDGYEQTDGEQDTQGGGGGGVNTAGQRTDPGSGADWSPERQRTRCIEMGTNRQRTDLGSGADWSPGQTETRDVYNNRLEQPDRTFLQFTKVFS